MLYVYMQDEEEKQQSVHLRELKRPRLVLLTVTNQQHDDKDIKYL